MEGWVLGGFFAYMVFILVVGVLAARRTSGKMESFYLGDRKIGAWVTAISASASSESGWLVLGCVAMGYVYGVTAYWITVGCVLGFAFNWLFFAERMRKASDANGSITIPEFLERATGDRTRLIRLLGVLIIFVLMFTYVAAQLNAAGLALESAFSWPYWVGVLVGAVVTIFYTTVGGFRAVSWTDLFQGLLMAAALIVLPVMAYVHLGGCEAVERKVRERPAETFFVLKGYVGGEYTTVRVERGRPFLFASGMLRVADDDDRLLQVSGGVAEDLPEVDGTPTLDLDALGVGTGRLVLSDTHHPKAGDDFFSFFGGMTGLVLAGWILGMLGIGLGYPGSPHVVARFMAAKSATEIRRGRAIALSWAVLAEGGAVTMGILGRALLPDVADPQWTLLETAEVFLHPLLVGLILAAIFAALRSTADSQLLVASSAVVRDFCANVVKMEMDEAKALRISRIVVLVLGVLAVLLALSESRFIFWFVLFSWAGLGASFAPSLILAVSWKRLSAAGVIASMIVGFATTLVWKLYVRTPLEQEHGLDVYELIPAFALAMLAAIVFSLAFPRRDAT
jgi:Na+/proline symporter